MDTLLHESAKKEEKVYFTLAKKKLFWIILCMILITISSVCVIYGSLRYESEQINVKEISRIGAVVDAGGSGTRLIIYSYANHSFRQLKYMRCEDNGLTKYSEDQLSALKKKLTACFTNGTEGLPKGKKVPIYVAATAGMRLLKLKDNVIYKKIWRLVRESLEVSEFKAAQTDTLTGFEEAKWAWVAANYLKHTLTNNHPQETYGTIDFGSSSLQIAFQYDNTERKANIGGDRSVETLDIEGYKRTIYAHSYLCYGAVEMERRFLAKLVKKSNYAPIVKNPCFFTGYTRNVSSDYLWAVPCSSGDYARTYLGEELSGPAAKTYTLRGTSNFTQCFRVLNDLLSRKCTNNDGLCGINNEFQPKLNGQFLALSGFYYNTKDLRLARNAGKSAYFDAAKSMCAQTWYDLTKGKKVSKYVSKRCFTSAYGYYLLANGFKFDASTWKIEFIKEIDGKNLGWSLGLMYSNTGNMYPISQHIKYVVKNSGLIALIILGVVCLFIALFIGLRVKSGTGSNSGDPTA